MGEVACSHVNQRSRSLVFVPQFGERGKVGPCHRRVGPVLRLERRTELAKVDVV
jgi:hypothetical protein